MANPNLGQVKQWPLKAGDDPGVNAVMAFGRVVVSGSTGLVATAYGVRGLTASRTSTGIYQLNFPISKGTHILPSQEAPSGFHYALGIVAKNSSSGMAELHVGAHSNGTLSHRNPATGTAFILQFSFHPRVTF